MEKTPVTRAATANWKETTPDASLSRHSPWRSVFWSLGISTRLPRVVTATASVGPRAAAKAKAAAKGIEDTSQWVKKPTTSTMSSTRPSAKAKTGLRWRQSAFLSDSRASQYSSGAIKNSRKNSGSKTMSRCTGVTASSTPRAICTSDTGTFGKICPTTAEISTATSMKIAGATISIGNLQEPSKRGRRRCDRTSIKHGSAGLLNVVGPARKKRTGPARSKTEQGRTCRERHAKTRTQNAVSGARHKLKRSSAHKAREGDAY